MNDMTTDIKSMTREELVLLMEELGEKPFRAGQIFSWIHQHLAEDYSEMTNLPKGLREKLADYPLVKTELVTVQRSAKDGTEKYLFRLDDGNLIESVLMRYHHGSSVCISSQAGCRMGCRFCASTIGGLSRSLLPSEMLSQIYHIQRETGERISNIVVMGTGEPLDNYENLLRFIELATCPEGLGISARSITVSTCGLVPEIRRLAEEKLQITLAISLHAPTDEIRKTLMPVANRYSIDELLSACREYFRATGRRITFEYSMISGVNDTPECAEILAGKLKGMACHVNLIPVNPVRERSFRRTSRTKVLEFKNKLEKYGINVTIRREMGTDIDGACGQLRRSYMEQK